MFIISFLVKLLLAWKHSCFLWAFFVVVEILATEVVVFSSNDPVQVGYDELLSSRDNAIVDFLLEGGTT